MSIYDGIRGYFKPGDKLDKIVGGFETTIGLLDEYVADSKTNIDRIESDMLTLKAALSDTQDQKERASRIAAKLRDILD